MSITEHELREIRKEQEKFLDRKCTVRRVYSVSEDEIVAHDFAKQVPFSSKPGFGFYRQVADQFKVVNPHILSFKWDQDIRVEDEIIPQDGAEGLFKVRDVSDQSSYLTLKRVLADRIH